MMSYSRADRVGGLIQQTLSDILLKEVKDPRLELTTITDVIGYMSFLGLGAVFLL